MTSQVLLEFPLIATPVEDQPARSRITKTVAEDDIEAKANFVDEVVHVTLEAAVVVTGEENPVPAGDEHPSCEVDGTDTGQPPVGVNVSCGVVDCQQHELRD